MDTKPLSPIMRECVERVRAHEGILLRAEGGAYWYVPNAQGEYISPTYGPSTVAALVDRGLLEFCQWRYSEGGDIPVGAKIIS